MVLMKKNDIKTEDIGTDEAEDLQTILTGPTNPAYLGALSRSNIKTENSSR